MRWEHQWHTRPRSCATFLFLPHFDVTVIYSSRRKYIFSSVLCLKNFHFATLWQSAVLGSFKCQSVLASPKISRKKCFGWNAIYRNEFGDFSSVFGSIWHVDYVCYMNKAGIQMYVTLNPGVYLIHTYYSTLHKEKKNEDNSSLKCHLREKIQSVIGCFKSAIFIKTNATIYLPQLLFHLPGCKQLLVSS